jgi:hypothetical protein
LQCGFEAADCLVLEANPELASQCPLLDCGLQILRMQQISLPLVIALSSADANGSFCLHARDHKRRKEDAQWSSVSTAAKVDFVRISSIQFDHNKRQLSGSDCEVVGVRSGAQSCRYTNLAFDRTQARKQVSTVLVWMNKEPAETTFFVDKTHYHSLSPSSVASHGECI